MNAWGFKVRSLFKRRSIASCAQCLVFSLTLTIAVSPRVPAAASDDQEPAQRGRPMTPADILTLQSITDVALSPDGKLVAAVVERPKKPGESFGRNNMREERRSDVWLCSTDGRVRENLTRGEISRAGYWEPVWSPDGKRLAMASTAGGDNVRAYIYELSSRRLRRVTRDGIDLSLRVASQQQQEAAPFAWLNSTTLLIGILPPHIRPLGLDERERTPSITAAGLPDAKRGRVPTAHVLTTGDPKVPAPRLGNVALSAIDVVAGSQRKIAHLPLLESRLAQRLVSLSPAQDYAAIVATDLPLPPPVKRQLQPHDLYPMRLGVVALSGGQNVKWVNGVRPAVFGFGGPLSPVRWAAKRLAFAVVGSTDDGDIADRSAFVIAAEDARVDRIAVRSSNGVVSGETRSFAAENVQWTSDDDLLVYGYRRGDAETSNVGNDTDQRTARRDWWVVKKDGLSRNLTTGISPSPQRLLPTQRPDMMLSFGSGQLWTINLGDGEVTPTNTSNLKALSIAWPAASRPAYPASHFASPQSTDEVLVVSPTDAGSDLYVANLSTSTPVLRKIGSMPTGAVIRDYSPAARTTIYQTTDTRLLAIKADHNEPVTLMSLNRGMEAVAKPQYRFIEYRSTDDKPLTGALLLPYGYRPDRRYPLVVNVYPGPAAPRGDWASPYTFNYMQPLVLASRGYAVLVPSMPMPPHGRPSDPMLELDKGVKPAIEKVVEMGIADPERVGVIGASFGGYSVYGLVTQTQRFKAAVALAGITELFGFYGALDLRYRYSNGLVPLLSPWGVESQQMSMGTGVTPWTDPSRYLRNSPIVYVDRVTTPVLMIHGDIDGVPISQAEQFYVGLARSGKRGKLVTYLGEGHGIESPANVIHMWNEILSWLDEFLMKPAERSGGG